MRLHSHIIEDFLEDFAFWRDWADTQLVAAELNPHDGVTYPGIFKAVPSYGVQQRVQWLLNRAVKKEALFLRLSLEGMQVPHQAHTDTIMGQFSLMVYLNRQEHCRGGTAFCRHKETGIVRTPHTEEELAILKRDENVTEAWEDYFVCEMQPNRALLFDAHLIHRALPIGGFGSSMQDGRLVLTGFFS